MGVRRRLGSDVYARGSNGNARRVTNRRAPRACDARSNARHGARVVAHSRGARRNFLPVASQKNVDSVFDHLYIASQRKEVTSTMAAKKAAKKATKKTTKKTTKKK